MNRFKYYKNIICVALALIIAVVPCRAQQVSLDGSVVTTSGTIAAGRLQVEFILSSDFAGTINSVAFTGADQYKAFAAPPGRWLPAISYTVTAGNARIFEIR